MFNLISILGQNTLPEQVEINKQNIAILADEVEKLGYQPKGVYDAETEYNHNDVVFYDNKLYVVTSDAAIVGVLPTNTTYWQQVTGDIRGQQGAQGEQGEAGEDGTDGVDALVCIVPYNSTNTAPTQGLIINGSALNFNRRPKLNDRFILIWNVTSTNSQYLCIMSVDTEGVIPMQCTVQYEYLLDGRPGEQGEQGETGEMALVYDRKIDFVWNEQSQQLISASLPIANFNRTPNLNEDFVAILHDTVSGVDYLAMGEVQTIVGTNVTSIVANDINRISGINGTNGTDGEDGEPALETAEEFSGAADPVLEQTLTMSNVSFNRTPKVHDALLVIYRNGMTGDMFIGNVRISAVGTVTTTGYFESIPRKITGAQGGGTTLNKYTVESPTIKQIFDIALNAKGAIKGSLSCTFGSYDISCSPTPVIIGKNKTYMNFSGEFPKLNAFVQGTLEIAGSGTTSTFLGAEILFNASSASRIISGSYNPTNSWIEYYNDVQLH